MSELDALRYPMGTYVPEDFSETLLKDWLLHLRTLPVELEYAIANLDENQLHTSYREGGWTCQQVVHHLADSHMNAFIRCKLLLTENKPVIKPYDQDTWVSLPDTRLVPVNISITLLHALHIRWHVLLSNVSMEDWNRTLVHPEYNKEMSLWYMLGLYVWHGRHHVAHINRLRERKGWR